MITLDAASHQAAQGMLNFSGWVRKQLKAHEEGLKAPSDIPSGRLLAIIMSRVQARYGFENDETKLVMDLMKLL